MTQLTVHELRQWIAEQRDFVLVDVRENHEHTAFNIGGVCMPLGTVMSRKSELPPDATIVLYCEKGVRSVIAAQRLEEYGYTRLYNLSGGMSAWKGAHQNAGE